MRDMKYLVFCFLVVLVSGCSHFLDEVSNDLIRPTKVEHYAE